MGFTPAFFAAAALSFWAPGHEAQVCPQGVTIRTVPAFTAADVTPDVDAGQTLDTIAAAAPVEIGRCELTRNMHAWRRLRYWPDMRCTIIVHELGHSVMGLGHSAKPNSAMAGAHTKPIPWCVRLVTSEYEKADELRAARRRHRSRSKPREAWRTVR